MDETMTVEKLTDYLNKLVEKGGDFVVNCVMDGNRGSYKDIKMQKIRYQKGNTFGTYMQYDNGLLDEDTRVFKEDNKMIIWKYLELYLSLTDGERRAATGYTDVNTLVNSMEVDSFIEKMEEYEKNIVLPGDEVITIGNFPKLYVCVSISYTKKICGFDKNGVWCYHYPNQVKKTGKHYDIQPILKDLGRR